MDKKPLVNNIVRWKVRSRAHATIYYIHNICLYFRLKHDFCQHKKTKNCNQKCLSLKKNKCPIMKIILVMAFNKDEYKCIGCSLVHYLMLDFGRILCLSSSIIYILTYTIIIYDIICIYCSTCIVYHIYTWGWKAKFAYLYKRSKFRMLCLRCILL